MKILFLVFHGFQAYNGISKKIRYQIDAMKACGADVRTCYYEVQSDGHRQWLVDDEVIDFIAQKLDLNIREMEGHLSKVVFYAQLTGKPCATMEDAREALKDIAEPEKESLDADRIVQTVCNFFQISKDDLFGKKKNKDKDDSLGL